MVTPITNQGFHGKKVRLYCFQQLPPEYSCPPNQDTSRTGPHYLTGYCIHTNKEKNSDHSLPADQSQPSVRSRVANLPKCRFYPLFRSFSSFLGKGTLRPPRLKRPDDVANLSLLEHKKKSQGFSIGN